MHPEEPIIRRQFPVLPILLLLVLATGLWFGISTYNDLQVKDEAVSANWSGVMNMYRRRADLLPNVIESVNTYAAHERELLVELTEARSALLGGLDADGGNPQSLARLQQAQQKFSAGLAHLLAIVERYPELKANSLFQGLIVELEGSENRISYARERYIGAVADYNIAVRRFPGNLIARELGLAVRPNFEDRDPQGVQRPPKVKGQ